ncbi:MAG: hypothetical protein WC919_06105 [Candidatus Paceibacterota bacterium]
MIQEAKKDLTEVPGTAPYALKQISGELKAATDLNQLLSLVDGAIGQYVGRGLSPANYEKFVNDIRSSDSIEKAQFVIWQWLVASSGNRVMYTGGERRRWGTREGIEAVASMITENVNSVLSPTDILLAELLEPYGCTIIPL